MNPCVHCCISAYLPFAHGTEHFLIEDGIRGDMVVSLPTWGKGMSEGFFYDRMSGHPHF